MHKILHLLLSDYIIDSRVRNETESLLEKDFQVDVFCLRSTVTPQIEYRNGVMIKRYGRGKAKVNKLLTAYAMFIIESFRSKYQLVHAHDFTGLLIGFVISKIHKIPLIYDSHELWSESKHQTYPEWLFKVAYRIERFCARRADFIITVSDSIRDYLREYFNHDGVLTIRNIPSYTKHKKVDIPSLQTRVNQDIPIFIYAGSIDTNRGLCTILTALSLLGNLEYLLLFLVDDRSFSELTGYVRELNLETQVVVMRSVPQDELLSYLRFADVGLIAIENTCLNHYYCLPNKIFEYIHAGLAVLCADVKEMSLLVTRNSIGMTFRSGDAQDLAEKMRQLINDRNMIRCFKSNALDLRDTMTWGKEYNKMKNIYEELMRI